MLYCAMILLGATGRVQAQFGSYSYYSTASSMPFSISSIGILANWSKPLGNFGADFAPAPAFELFLETKSDRNDRFRGNVSFIYANYKPRLDTIPVYMVGGSSMMSYKLYPGKLAYKDAKNMMLMIDYSYVVVRKGKFDLALGGGMGIGKMWHEYYLEYETQLNQITSVQDFTLCLRAQSSLTYKLMPYVHLRGAFGYQWQTFTNWSVQFPVRNLGFGLVFNFENDDDE